MNNQYIIIEIFIFIVVVCFVSYRWFKNENSVWKSVLFPLWTCLVYYFNAPNFLSLSSGLEQKTQLFSFPFYLYNQGGIIYIVISNVLIAILGVYLGKPNSIKMYSEKDTRKLFDSFIADSTEIKVIGRDLDFLLDSDYSSQKTQIIKLKDKAKLLCELTDDIKLIGLYKNLLEQGVQVKAYSSRDGVANLKGQIKKNERGDKSGLFVVKNAKPSEVSERVKKEYEIIDLKSEYLLEGVNNQFDITFSSSIHPVIRCIALDLGGVYLDGDLDTFYQFLFQEYGIKMIKRKKDRLNIDDDLMLGKISILDFIKRRDPDAVHKVPQDRWEDILQHWQSTWTTNPRMKCLIEFLNKCGYSIVPFSNLDKDNGDKYLRDHYLPFCCKHHYFSYESGKVKPNRATFRDFASFLKSNSYIKEDYQILLIDDEQKNLNVAASLGWQTIQFFNDSAQNENSVETLVQELKKKSILPEPFDFHD